MKSLNQALGKTTIHLISILLLVILVQSCSKTDPCPNGQENYYNLTDEEKSKIPYTGTDTLVFVSDKGDTVTLIGQGKQQTYKRTTSGGNPDCQISYNYDNYERIDYNYLANNPILNNIDFSLQRYDDNGSFDCILNGFYKFNFGILEANDSLRYKDTVIYKNKTIKCLRMVSYTDPSTNYYFNYLFGIVKIKINDKLFILK